LIDHIRFDALPVAGIEAMTACTSRSYPRHTHDQYGIGVVDSGAHVSWSDRGQVEAGPGNLICVNPGEVHDGRALGKRSRSWRLLYFDPGLMEEVCGDVLDGARASLGFVAPVFADDEVRRQFDAAFAYSAVAAEQRHKMACETALLTLVAGLQNHSSARPRRTEGPTPCIRRARDRIDADPAAHLTLAELAGEVGLSRYQLIRGFARELGLTPHGYIVQRRIALARQLIRAGRALAEVAALAGFCDQSHLTRCFARQFGVTPSRYVHFRPRP
jgi:AraC-like DNA-binding protein